MYDYRRGPATEWPRDMGTGQCLPGDGLTVAGEGRTGARTVSRGWLCVCAMLVGVLVSGAATPPGWAQDKGDVSFRWAFGAMVGTGTDKRLEPITQDTSLKSGDQMKMFIELNSKCFVYVLYQSSQGEIQLLFPFSLQQFEADYQVSKPYYVPKGDAWFQLDEKTGAESFYLLASAQRLTSLENLLRQYDAAQSAQKGAIAQQVLAEIRNIRKQNRGFTTTPERPVAIGGTVRGVDSQKPSAFPDVSTIASKVSADGFYGRTFTIDHK